MTLDEFTEKEDEIKNVEKTKPLDRDYIPLGEGKGIRITLWDNNLRLERVERDPHTNKWDKTQEINLARPVLERLYIRIPIWFNKLIWKRGSKSEKNKRKVCSLRRGAVYPCTTRQRQKQVLSTMLRGVWEVPFTQKNY